MEFSAMNNDRIQGSSPLIVPLDILEQCNPFELAVYCTYAKIALSGQKTDETIQLPAMPDLAKMAGVSISTLQRAERRLQQLGWLTIQHMDLRGRTLRRRAVVKLYAIETTVKIENQLKMIVEEMSTRIISTLNRQTLHNIHSPSPDTNVVNPPSDQVPLEVTYRFPASFKHILASIVLHDAQGQRVFLPPEATLYELSGHAGEKDLEVGLLRLSSYRHAVNNINALWRSFFQGGKFMRKTYKFPSRNVKAGKDLPRASEEEIALAGKRLANGETVEIGKIGARLRRYCDQFDCLEIRGVHATLKPGFNLSLRFDDHGYLEIASMTQVKGDIDVKEPTS